MLRSASSKILSKKGASVEAPFFYISPPGIFTAGEVRAIDASFIGRFFFNINSHDLSIMGWSIGR
jgi:hypothetical protein